jgi:hypothetical protein
MKFLLRTSQTGRHFPSIPLYMPWAILIWACKVGQGFELLYRVATIFRQSSFPLMTDRPISISCPSSTSRNRGDLVGILDKHP